MNKKIRNFGLVGLASAFLCTAMVGAALLPNVANADDTVAMSSLIGAKTDNVTVTAAQSFSSNGDHKETINGLKVAPSSSTVAWEATLNTTFTQNATIKYMLMADPASTANPVYMANAFTVKDSTGKEVAEYVVFCRDTNSNGLSSMRGYLCSKVGETDTFTSQKAWWNGTRGSIEYQGVWNLAVAASSAKNPFEINNQMYYEPYLAPKYHNWYNLGGSSLAEGEEIDNNVYFEYNNEAHTLTVKSDTYDLDKEAGLKGSGDIIEMGTIENIDLSAGYTISVGSADNVMCSDEIEYVWGSSSAVLITAVNGVETEAATAPANATNEAISYAGEYDKEGVATINLGYSQKLSDFTYTAKLAIQSTTDSSTTLPLNGQTSFSYTGNKKFVASEKITVSYGTIEKQYQINVLTAASIAATDFIKPLTTTAVVEANQQVDSHWTAAAMSGISSGLKISSTDTRGNEANPQMKHTQAQFNGIFKDDAEIAFSLVCNNGSNDMPYFMVTDTQDNKVLLAAAGKKNDTWGVNGQGRSYVYDYGTSKYTTSKGGAVHEVTYWIGDSNSDANALGNGDTVLPRWDNETGEKSWGRYLFDYDAVNKTMSVKAINAAGTYLTIGTVSCDLSAGYVITMGNVSALSIEEGNMPKSSTALTAKAFFSNMEALHIMEVNGYSMASDTIGTDVFNQDIVCGDSNELDVVKGSEAPAFAYTSEFVLGSFVQVTSEKLTADLDTKTAGLQNVTVTAANDYSEEFAVTVKGLTDMLTETSAMAGAQMRISDPTGLRFGMTVGDDDMALIEANVGEGKYYTEVSYRMFIVPYAYAATYGHFTAENLFGEQAKYTWKGKTTASADGAVEIMERTTVLGMQPGAAAWENPEDYYLYFAITKLEGAALTAKFMGIGCVELTTEDGDKEYKVVSLYDTYVVDGDNSANNVRSVYDVAVAVYNDSEEPLAARQLAYDFIATVEGENFTDERPVA